MVRRQAQPEAMQKKVLDCVHLDCPECGHFMHNKYDNYRRVRTLTGVVQLRLRVRRCPNPECNRYHQAYRPENESKWALPQQEFGLDVIAYIGTLRYREHRSTPEIHRHLGQKGLSISQRSVSNLLACYEELVALRLGEVPTLQQRLAGQKRVIEVNP